MITAREGSGQSPPTFPPFDNSVVVIIADDLGIEHLKCYRDVTSSSYPGTEYVPPAGWPNTPNIETRLLPNGLRSTQAYATPYCSSTRSTMQTGRFGMRTGIGKPIPNNGTNNTIYPRDASGNYASLAKLVKQSPAVPGYLASAWGKHHTMSGTPTGPFGDAIALAIVDPAKFQYDWYSGHLFVLEMADICPGGGWAGWPRYMGQLSNIVPASLTTTYFHCDVVTEAETWIQGQTQPFVVWCAPQAPFEHYYNPPNGGQSCNTGTGCTFPFHNVDPTKLPAPGQQGATDDQKRYCYRANIEALDTMVGRILDQLQARSAQAPWFMNWYDTTTVILVADNGTPANDPINHFWDANAVKGTVREGGIRVPWIVAGKAVTPSRRGQSSPMLVCSADIYPTVGSIVGAPAPTSIDGTDLYALLQGAIWVRPYVYSETFDPLFDPTSPNGPSDPSDAYTSATTWKRTATDGHWKVILEDSAPFTRNSGSWNKTYWEVTYDDGNKLVELSVPKQAEHDALVSIILGL